MSIWYKQQQSFSAGLQNSEVEKNCRKRLPSGIVFMCIVFFGGCAYPKKGADAVVNPTEKTSLDARHNVKAPVPAQPPKPESLEAVEEFLARTQDYRLEATAAKPSPTQVGSGTEPAREGTKGPGPQETQIVPDAAYANAQLSVGEPPRPATQQAVPAIESVSIRAPQQRAAPPEGAPSPKVTNIPLEIQSMKGPDAVESVVATFREEWKVRKDVLSEWKLRLLLLALDRPDDARALSEQGTSALKGVLPGLVETACAVRQAVRNPERDSEVALREIDSLRDTLAMLVGPRVSRVALCRKVATFGVYDEMGAGDLVSGRTVQTIVYVEIENLEARSTDEGSFEANLATRLEIFSADGKSVWSREEPEVTDRCTRQRRDFFVAQRVTLPPTLPEGEFVLKVSVEDKHSEKICEGTKIFRLQSPLSAARQP